MSCFFEAGIRRLDYPAIREGSEHVNEKPGLNVVNDDGPPSIDEVALLIEARVELHQNVEHEAHVNGGLQVHPHSCRLVLEAKAVRDEEALVDYHEHARQLPGGAPRAVRIKEQTVLTRLSVLSNQLYGLIIEVLLIRAKYNSIKRLALLFLRLILGLEHFFFPLVVLHRGLLLQFLLLYL